MAISPIEDCYAILQKHSIAVSKEEIEKCDTLRYSWEKLKQVCIQKSHALLEIQAKHKDKLKVDVVEFVKKCDSFYADYVKNGPIAVGISPREASDRLFIYYNQFETINRKYLAYTGGEELFGKLFYFGYTKSYS